MKDGDYAHNWPLAHSGGTYGLFITKFLACDEYPDLCSSDPVDGEVVVDEGAPTQQREVALDENLTVVIVPLRFDESPGGGDLVGDGIAFGLLLTDLNRALTADWNPDHPREDPDSPFGLLPYPGETEEGIYGYRGPGGTHLIPQGGWTALEIRDGMPILYIAANQFAG
jgi:hypothetical protein